jgi:hypothetical protein
MHVGPFSGFRGSIFGTHSTSVLIFLLQVVLKGVFMSALLGS